RPQARPRDRVATLLEDARGEQREGAAPRRRRPREPVSRPGEPVRRVVATRVVGDAVADDPRGPVDGGPKAPRRPDAPLRLPLAALVLVAEARAGFRPALPEPHPSAPRRRARPGRGPGRKAPCPAPSPFPVAVASPPAGAGAAAAGASPNLSHGG